MLRSELLKDGTKHLSGVDETTIRNIEAVRDLQKILRTSLGPQGMNKMVINDYGKLFVTSDSSTILKELDVYHPAAKLCVENAKRQEEEVGDGTNLVVVFCGELLNQAEILLRNGIHQNDVIKGFEKALALALEILPTMVSAELTSATDTTEIAKYLKNVLATKQYGYEDLLSEIVAKACCQICPKNPEKFNVDNVRVCKVPGGGVSDITVIKGFIVDHDAEGTVKLVKDAKIAVYAAGIDYTKPETKDSFLITNPEKLEGYGLAQEEYMEKIIKEIADSGVNVVVSGGAIGDLAMHFIEKYKLMAIKVQSKFDIKRLCSAVGASPLVRLGAPIPEEMGKCDSVHVEEVGSAKVTFFKQDNDDTSQISTIIARAATPNLLDDLERACNDGVDVYKYMVRDGKFLSGAGASEIELAHKLRALGETEPGQEQYGIKKFAEALEVIPRTLAENSGNDSTLLLSKLYAAHTGDKKADDGIDIESGEIRSAVEMGVFDLLITKREALRLATDAAITILRIDQIIMARPAIGPKVPKMGGTDSGD